MTLFHLKESHREQVIKKKRKTVHVVNMWQRNSVSHKSLYIYMCMKHEWRLETLNRNIKGDITQALPPLLHSCVKPSNTMFSHPFTTHWETLPGLITVSFHNSTGCVQRLLLLVCHVTNHFFFCSTHGHKYYNISKIKITCHTYRYKLCNVL